MRDETPRGLRFGSVAERYERFRPGYPAEVLDVVLGDLRATDALEIGAGTGKATRVFAGRGIAVTAVEPDPQMAEVLARETAGLPVTVVVSTLETLPPRPPVDLLYAAAAWHWTDPGTRWERAAALLRPGGVFASIGGPTDLADPDLATRVEELHHELVGDDRIAGILESTDREGAMRWPGNELLASQSFTDVEQHDLTDTYPLAADDMVGLMSTVSAVLLLAPAARESYLTQVRALLPDPVEVRRVIGVHRARRV